MPFLSYSVYVGNLNTCNFLVTLMDIYKYVFRYRSVLFIAIYVVGFVISQGPSLTAYLFALFHLSLMQVRIFVVACSIIGVMGFLLRVWGSGYLGSPIVHSRLIHGESLITCGPYAHVRHPLYLGSLLMIIGFLPVLPLFGFIFIVVAVGGLVYLLIAAEERVIMSGHEEEYLKYRSAVRAIIPRFRGLTCNSAIKFNLRKGLESEILYIFILSPLIGGVFLSSIAFLVSFFSLLMIGLVLFLILRSSRLRSH